MEALGRQRTGNEKGELLGEYEIVDGNGEVRLWRDDGTLRDRGQVVAGLRSGEWTSFDADGKRTRVAHYAEGELHGLDTGYDATGGKQREGRWVQGERDGEWTTFDPQSGRRERIDRYVAGQEGITTYFQDGEPLGELPRASACDETRGLSAVLEASGEHGIDERERCVQRSRSFAGAIQVGSFAHDRGCKSVAELLDCEVVSGGLKARSLLVRAGWRRASAENRRAIAERYLDEIQGTFKGSYISEPDKPEYSVAADGTVVVEIWRAKPSGMRRGRSIERYRYEFKKSGRLVATRIDSREEGR
jgi:hypothetical protein